MRLCPAVLTHDTGFMHIAAAFGQPCFTLWGNTVPEFGMYPWRTRHIPLQVTGLGCRPCSKIGHASCPKGHFRCMRDLQPDTVLAAMMTST
jgi:ADP-heptose:LPS heptosyltransferase